MTELRLCDHDLMVAVQEYLAKRWTWQTPQVTKVVYKNHALEVQLEQPPEPAKPSILPKMGVAYAAGCSVCGLKGLSGYVCGNQNCPTKVTAC